MNTTTKYLFLFAAVLGLSSATDDSRRQQWRIQRGGTRRVKGVPAKDTILRPISEDYLEPFPAELRAQVKKDYATLLSMTPGQDLHVSYGYSEKTGWVTGQPIEEKRTAWDGIAYSKEEFMAWYGNVAEWDHAEIKESSCGWRVCLLEDGTMVQKSARSGTIRIIVPPTIKYGTLVDAAMSHGHGAPDSLGLGIGGTDQNNTCAKFSYTSRQGQGSNRLTLREALRFENDHFVRFFQESFQKFAAYIPQGNHIHIEWMPIRQEDLDQTVIEWMLIDCGVKFNKHTNMPNTANINGTNGGSVIRTAEPSKTLIRPACLEAGKSPIALEVCPLRKDVGGKADEGGEHCANIRNFMLWGSLESVKSVWAEVGRQALDMVRDTDRANPLRIWTIGGSIGWLHIKMCRDFAGCVAETMPAGRYCKGWRNQCATEQARRNNGVAWHRVQQ